MCKFRLEIECFFPRHFVVFLLNDTEELLRSERGPVWPPVVGLSVWRSCKHSEQLVPYVFLLRRALFKDADLRLQI